MRSSRSSGHGMGSVGTVNFASLNGTIIHLSDVVRDTAPYAGLTLRIWSIELDIRENCSILQ